MSGLLFGSGKTNAVQPQQAVGIRVQSSVYGKPITLVYGTNRISGNLIWYGDFKAKSVSQKSGGKGGGGGSTSSYTYSAAIAIGLCEGPITGIGLMWSGQNVYDAGAYSATLGFGLFVGQRPQAPWGFLSANYPAQAIGYTGTAYIANSGLELGSNPTLPNYSFEVMGLLTTGNQDVNPAGIINDFLPNPYYGAGWQSAWIDNVHLVQYQNYCAAMGFLFSPVYDSQTQGQAAIQDLLDSSNSTCWWSEGVFKVKPYCDQPVTGNGVTYTPDVTPVFALNDDAFIYAAGQDPIQITRMSPADAYNVVDVEFVNRFNQYATQIAESSDMFAIQKYGRRPDTARMYHHITTQAAAQSCADLIKQRNLYIRNSYKFMLGWVYCALEPMDLVTLTDARLGMNNVPVRITAVEENANGELTVTAEDFPAGVATAPLYTVQAPAGSVQNWNAAADAASQVMFYEPPGTVTNNQLVLWIGIAGIGAWGGANVWVSVDGLTYTLVGTQQGSARVGVTSSALGINGDPDTVEMLGVDLTHSAGTMLSGTQADADSFNTLCVVGSELISYQTAALTGVSKYNLSYLRRGAYATAESSWAAGTQFMRADQSIFSYPFDSSLIGKPIYVKLVSFNQYGGGMPLLANVPAYTYNVLGSAVNAALPDVQGLFTNFVSGITQLFWSPVTDYRNFDYEIRVGTSWGAGIFLARTSAISFATSGNGTYWVAAHFRNPNGFDVYSDIPASILVTGSVLILNNIASYDEVATSWSGTLSGGAVIASSILTLQGAGNILSVSNILTATDIIHFGGVAASGSYALPSGHAINVGRVANTSVRFNYTGYGQNITDNVLVVGNVLTAVDLLDSVSGQYVTITPQIAIAPASGVYGAWQNFQPGVYVGQYFKAQILIASSNTNVTPLVTALTFAVDLDTRVDNFTNQAIASGGTTLTYPNGTFNKGPNGATTPNVQVSVLSASSGDTVVLTSKTLTQVTVQVLNGGSGVARTVDVAVTGY